MEGPFESMPSDRGAIEALKAAQAREEAEKSEYYSSLAKKLRQYTDNVSAWHLLNEVLNHAKTGAFIEDDDEAQAVVERCNQDGKANLAQVLNALIAHADQAHKWKQVGDEGREEEFHATIVIQNKVNGQLVPCAAYRTTITRPRPETPDSVYTLHIEKRLERSPDRVRGKMMFADHDAFVELQVKVDNETRSITLAHEYTALVMDAPPQRMQFTPRAYQNEVLVSYAKFLEQQKGHGLAVLGTGTGKTAVIAGIQAAMGRVVALVPNAKLAGQTVGDVKFLVKSSREGFREDQKDLRTFTFESVRSKVQHLSGSALAAEVRRQFQELPKENVFICLDFSDPFYPLVADLIKQEVVVSDEAQELTYREEELRILQRIKAQNPVYLAITATSTDVLAQQFNIESEADLVDNLDFRTAQGLKLIRQTRSTVVGTDEVVQAALVNFFTDTYVEPKCPGYVSAKKIYDTKVKASPTDDRDELQRMKDEAIKEALVRNRLRCQRNMSFSDNNEILRELSGIIESIAQGGSGYQIQGIKDQREQRQEEALRLLEREFEHDGFSPTQPEKEEINLGEDIRRAQHAEFNLTMYSHIYSILFGEKAKDIAVELRAGRYDPTSKRMVFSNTMDQVIFKNWSKRDPFASMSEEKRRAFFAEVATKLNQRQYKGFYQMLVSFRDHDLLKSMVESTIAYWGDSEPFSSCNTSITGPFFEWMHGEMMHGHYTSLASAVQRFSEQHQEEGELLKHHIAEKQVELSTLDEAFTAFDKPVKNWQEGEPFKTFKKLEDPEEPFSALPAEVREHIYHVIGSKVAEIHLKSMVESTIAYWGESEPFSSCDTSITGSFFEWMRGEMMHGHYTSLASAVQRFSEQHQEEGEILKRHIAEKQVELSTLDEAFTAFDKPVKNWQAPKYSPNIEDTVPMTYQSHYAEDTLGEDRLPNYRRMIAELVFGLRLHFSGGYPAGIEYATGFSCNDVLRTQRLYVWRDVNYANNSLMNPVLQEQTDGRPVRHPELIGEDFCAAPQSMLDLGIIVTPEVLSEGTAADKANIIRENAEFRKKLKETDIIRTVLLLEKDQPLKKSLNTFDKLIQRLSKVSDEMIATMPMMDPNSPAYEDHKTKMGAVLRLEYKLKELKEAVHSPVEVPIAECMAGIHRIYMDLNNVAGGFWDPYNYRATPRRSSSSDRPLGLEERMKRVTASYYPAAPVYGGGESIYIGGGSSPTFTGGDSVFLGGSPTFDGAAASSFGAITPLTPSSSLDDGDLMRLKPTTGQAGQDLLHRLNSESGRFDPLMEGEESEDADAAGAFTPRGPDTMPAFSSEPLVTPGPLAAPEPLATPGGEPSFAAGVGVGAQPEPSVPAVPLVPSNPPSASEADSPTAAGPSRDKLFLLTSSGLEGKWQLLERAWQNYMTTGNDGDRTRSRLDILLKRLNRAKAEYLSSPRMNGGEFARTCLTDIQNELNAPNSPLRGQDRFILIRPLLALVHAIKRFINRVSKDTFFSKNTAVIRTKIENVQEKLQELADFNPNPPVPPA